MTWTIQLADAPGYGDYEFSNQGSAIAAGLAVILDATNALVDSNSTTTFSLAVKLASSDGVGAPIGVTMESMAASGGLGRVRTKGIAACTASGSITAGAAVMIEASTGKVKTQTSALQQLGYALTGAADGEPVLVLIAQAKNA